MREAAIAVVGTLILAGCSTCRTDEDLWLGDFVGPIAMTSGGGATSLYAELLPGVYRDEFVRMAFERLRRNPASLKCHFDKHSLRGCDAWAMVAADIMNIPYYFFGLDTDVEHDAEIVRLVEVAADKATGESRYLEDFVDLWGDGSGNDVLFRVNRVVLRETICRERFRRMALRRLRENPESLKTAASYLSSLIRGQDLWAAALAAIEGVDFEIVIEEDERDERIKSLLARLQSQPAPRE